MLAMKIASVSADIHTKKKLVKEDLDFIEWMLSPEGEDTGDGK